MARRTSPAEEVTAFELLSQKIEAAVRTKGTIKLPDNIINKIQDELKTVRQAKTSVLNADIINLILPLDMQEHCCSRLETAAFIIILETFLHTISYEETERGVYLLAESIYYDCHKRSASRAIEARKASIGKACIHRLISCFVNASGNARVRRWIGVMILQLLDSEKSRIAFEAGPEDNKRKLGTMVVKEGNDILRIICGYIIKALLASGIAIKDLWPVNTDPKLFAEFPVLSQKDNHWNNAFQAYIDQLFNIPDSLQSYTGRLYFVQAIITSPQEIRFSGCTISVFIDGEVSICTQSHGESFMECLDIPLDLILDVETAKTVFENAEGDVPESEHIKITDAVDLIVTLKSSVKSTCFVNAAPADIREIRLTISKEDLAEIICADILDEVEQLRKTKGRKISQNKETIVVIGKGVDDYHMTDLALVDKDVHIRGIPGSGSGIPHILGTTAAAVQMSCDANSEAVENAMGDNHAQYVNPKDIQYTDSQKSEANLDILADLQTIISGKSQQIRLETRNDYGRQPLLAATVSKPSRYASDPASGPIDVVQVDYPENDNQNLGLDDEEAEYDIYKADVVPYQAMSNPTHLGQFHNPDVMELTKDSHSLPLSPAKPSHLRSPPTRSTVQNTTEAFSKPNTIAPQPSNQRRKKPALIPKISSGKLKAILPTDSSGTTIDNTERRVDSQLLKTKKSRKSVKVKGKNYRSPARHSQKKSVKNSMAVAQMEPKPITIEKENVYRQDSHDSDICQTAKTITKSFAAKLTVIVDELDDSDQPNMRKTQSSPPPTSKGDKLDNYVTIDGTSSASRHQHAELERDGLLLPSKQCPETGEVQMQASHKLVLKGLKHMSPTRNASTTLNRVLENDKPLVDDNLARKTPIVSFSAKGPLNQGLIKPEISSIVQVAEAQRQAGFPVRVEAQDAVPTGKRKRAADDLAEMERAGPHQLSMPRNSQVASSSHSRRPLPPAFQDEVEAPFSNASRASQNQRALGSQRSRVDEKGSPRASGSSYQQRKDFQESVTKITREGQTHSMNNADVSGGLSSMHATSLAVVSDSCLCLPHSTNPQKAFSFSDIKNVPGHIISKALPRDKENRQSFSQQLILAKLDEKQTLPILSDEYVARHLSYKKVRAEKGLEVEGGRVLGCKPLLGDPFVENACDRNLIDLTGKLQQCSKERFTHEPTASPMRAEPVKRRADIFEDPEVTLVNMENQVALEDISSSDEGTDCTLAESEDPEARTPTASVESTFEDEWRLALKPHQKGMIDTLYQISQDLVRYLISHEEAITDLLDDYQRNGKKLIEKLGLDHLEDRQRIYHGIETAKNNMRKTLMDTRQQIVKSRHDIGQRGLSNMDKQWSLENDLVEKMIEEARKQYA